MLRTLFVLIVFFAPVALSAQDTSKSTEQFVREIDQKIPQLLQDFSIPGAAIVLIENGEIVLQKGYGFADIKKGVPVTTETGFNIGSISKTLAAWGVMKLLEEGKIDLDTPIEKYLTRWHLPESAFDSDGVTIRRLLSHTAGLSLHSVSAGPPYDKLPTLEEWLIGKNNGLGRVEIILEPGSRHKYSGGGYGVLQLIIEEVSGQTFEDYMQAQILDPLGMTNSSYKIDDNIRAASASPYDEYGETTDFVLFTAQAGAGLHTTLEDFTRFAMASLYRHKDNEKYNPVLSPDIIQQMMKPAYEGGNWPYGMGYQTRQQTDSFVFSGHSGSNAGWQANFRVNPASNDGFIVLTNGSAGGNICNQMMCDWVRWKTGESLGDWCQAKPNIGHKLKQIIDSKGIDDLDAIYTDLKENEPNTFDFSENHLNDLGYYYLGREELEKAIAVFKVNTEAFPYGWNTYDSYGEALLAHGARGKAIENYKQSVFLNPGNESGINVLKELGVSTKDLHYKVPVEHLKLLEGEYIATSDPDKKISYAVENGELLRTYDDSERTIKLVPIGNNEFVYLDYGIHVVFDTRDLNDITLTTPNTGEFKKVK